MKKILLAIGILFLLVSMSWAGSFWGNYYKQFTASGDNQEVLAVEASQFCTVARVEVINNGSTTATVTVHWEGAAGAYNRLHVPISAAAGEGIIVDYIHPVRGPRGADIDVDISATTTIDVLIEYSLSSSP